MVSVTCAAHLLTYSFPMLGMMMVIIRIELVLTGVGDFVRNNRIDEFTPILFEISEVESDNLILNCVSAVGTLFKEYHSRIYVHTISVIPLLCKFIYFASNQTLQNRDIVTSNQFSNSVDVLHLILPPNHK